LVNSSSVVSKSGKCQIQFITVRSEEQAGLVAGKRMVFCPVPLNKYGSCIDQFRWIKV